MKEIKIIAMRSKREWKHNMNETHIYLISDYLNSPEGYHNDKWLFSVAIWIYLSTTLSN